MTDLQSYITVLIGFLVSCIMALAGTERAHKLLKRILIWELILKTSCYVVKILLTPVNKGPFLKLILKYNYFPDMIFMGLFLGCVSAGLISKKRSGCFYRLLLDQACTIAPLLIAAIASTYLLSALSAINNFKAWITFFEACGYSKAFLIFIIIMEIAGGFGVLFKKTRWLAILILTADMAGATFTHFHNYFSGHIPHPFGNSLPSLAMLTFLISLTILLVRMPYTDSLFKQSIP